MVEEANSRERRKNDNSYLSMLRERSLDPVTAKRMQKIEQHYLYLSTQLQEVSNRLDRDWVEHLEKRKKAKKSLRNLSSTEAIYKTVLSNQNTIHNLRKSMDYISKKAAEKKLEMTSRRKSKTKFTKRSGAEELSQLADAFLEAKISSTEEENQQLSKKIPSRTQNILKSLLVSSPVTAVRPTSLYSPSQSRLLSRSFLYKEKKADEVSKTVGIPPEQKDVVTLKVSSITSPLTSNSHAVVSVDRVHPQPHHSLEHPSREFHSISETVRGGSDISEVPEKSNENSFIPALSKSLFSFSEKVTSTPASKVVGNVYEDISPPDSPQSAHRTEAAKLSQDSLHVVSHESSFARSSAKTASAELPQSKVVSTAVPTISSSEKRPIFFSVLPASSVSAPTSASSVIVSKPFNSTKAEASGNDDVEGPVASKPSSAPFLFLQPAPTSSFPNFTTKKDGATSFSFVQPTTTDSQKLSFDFGKSASKLTSTPLESASAVKEKFPETSVETASKSLFGPSASIKPFGLGAAFGSTASSGSLFGTPKSTTAASAPSTTGSLFFGATKSTTAPAQSLTFGAPSSGAVASEASTGSLTFGAPTSTADSAGFALGASKSTADLTAAASSFGFGIPKSSEASPPTPSFSFASAASAPESTQTSSFTFGVPKSSAASTRSSFFEVTPEVAATPTSGAQSPVGSSASSAVPQPGVKNLFSKGVTLDDGKTKDAGEQEKTPTKSPLGGPSAAEQAGALQAAEEVVQAAAADSTASESASAAEKPASPLIAALLEQKPAAEASQAVSPLFGVGSLSFADPAATTAAQQTTATTAADLVKPVTTSASVFGASSQTGSLSFFGQAGGGSSVFSPTTTTTAAEPGFGQTASTTSSFFGQPAAAKSSFFSKPEPSPFGQTTPASAAAAQGSSPFGSATSTPSKTSFFSSPAAATEPQKQQQPASVFGGSGAASPGSGFGGSSQPSAASGFSFGSSAFGQTQGSFGLAKSVFGQSTPAFGDSTSPSTGSFGQSSNSSVFGQGSFFSGLGGQASAENASKNVFAMGSLASPSSETNVFGASSSFGSSGGSAFGSKPSGGAFSGGAFSSGGGPSVAQSGFGAFQQTPQKTAAGFGASPTFGGAATFGTSPTFGGTPTFGSGSPLGSSAFGSQSSQTANFSNFASSGAPTFGSIASQGGGGSAFGNAQQSAFGQPSSFGGGGFGSPPSFGGQQSSFGGSSGPATNSSAFTQWRN